MTSNGFGLTMGMDINFDIHDQQGVTVCELYMKNNMELMHFGYDCLTLTLGRQPKNVDCGYAGYIYELFPRYLFLSAALIA